MGLSVASARTDERLASRSQLDRESAALRIAVVADGDAFDVRTYSGVPYHMVKALRAHFPHLTVIDPTGPWLFERLAHVGWTSTSGRLRLDWTRWGAATRARPILVQLDALQPDAVLCISNSPIAAVLARHWPVIHISDATFDLMRDYYAGFRRMFGFQKSGADGLEAEAITGARLCLYSSAWAQASALEAYAAESAKVHFIPWGCNRDDEAPETPATRQDQVCHLLFAGMDWTRKGGDVAIETTAALRATGIDVHLHLVGAAPPGEYPPHVTAYGVISKSTAEGVAKFNGLLADASFLLAPSRQDCAPMVFAEANFYGVPVISSDVGGLRSVVEEGVNGCLLPADAKATDYAALIAALWRDRRAYEALRRTSRKRYAEVLNWETWASAAAALVAQSTQRLPASDTGLRQ